MCPGKRSWSDPGGRRRSLSKGGGGLTGGGRRGGGENTSVENRKMGMGARRRRTKKSPLPMTCQKKSNGIKKRTETALAHCARNGWSRNLPYIGEFFLPSLFYTSISLPLPRPRPPPRHFLHPEFGRDSPPPPPSQPLPLPPFQVCLAGIIGAHTNTHAVAISSTAAYKCFKK